jgi:TPR repeat protein
MSGRSVSSACLVAMAAVVAPSSACRNAGSTESGPVQEACVAESIGTLRLLSTVPTCASGDWLCRTRCRFDDASSCLALGYAAGRDSASQEAVDLYRRACLLGAANACTNYAASIWARDHTDDELACARRTFEKACSSKEPFACGMVGRVMLETDRPSYAMGRQYLEGACADVGGFSCRVLARHLESGRLGEYRPESIRDLLRRACAGGDPDACGDPRTAADTFQ